ncbi:MULTISPECIES: sensor domain-containing diguanylate cyclase [Pseudoalteromonas]|jgi:diguanylate cyclase (GGDEF)-like protein|uniref:sensor domain-containing diguanylate cyclase n=1 Tax=Pseudoalteromonas TaxID=53246 RepID=UPI001573AE32|nr:MULTISPECIES: sensor domain-containing diguanylate cyclase [Pseudoalteromonas]MBR8843584.1 sensor domain-containing diguanylate cyclase [Pseudoalteromonas sp. JC3]NSY33224.1 sensor domain-containing diguanylate cyclase [Pseudoalteromonas sp. JC28]QUI68338.1 diguanylate cyclase [Pseudoalteromonas sp. M8]UDM64020.1 sensor domain-containing diguanylate cyclase [Pseudoalteromonas piscicida]WJE11522.1 sensor domain-containing diguanylate cyclase [Pseudoalteromonas sp. JC3]
MSNANHLQSLLSEVLNKSDDAVAIVSNKSVLEFCNKAMAKLIGQPSSHITGRTLSNIFDPQTDDTFDDRIDGDELTEWFLGLSNGCELDYPEIEIDTLSGEFFRLRCFSLQNDAFVIYGDNITTTKAMHSELDHLRKELDFITKTDPLTGVASRRQLSDKIDSQIRLYERYRTPFSVILTDLDNFRAINEQFGHEAGDLVLVHVSSRLSDMLRDTDLIARLGGEEFALVLPNTGLEGAILVAERARIMIEQASFQIAVGEEVDITSSFGVAEFGAGESGVESIIRRADTMLLEAKSSGRNRVVPNPH